MQTEKTNSHCPAFCFFLWDLLRLTAAWEGKNDFKSIFAIENL